MTRCLIVPTIVRSIISKECWDGQFRCYVGSDCESRRIQTRLERRSLSGRPISPGAFTKTGGLHGDGSCRRPWRLSELGCRLLSVVVIGCHLPLLFPGRASSHLLPQPVSCACWEARNHITGQIGVSTKLPLPLVLGSTCCTSSTRPSHRVEPLRAWSAVSITMSIHSNMTAERRGQARSRANLLLSGHGFPPLRARRP